MKKRLLFVYDYMMTGGTTTALLSLLDNLDKEKYEIDLLLYKNGGEFFDKIPQHVNVLEPAAVKSFVPEIAKKLWLSIWNGQLFRAFYYYLRNKNNKSKSLKMAVWQSTETAHAKISRKLSKSYDAVVGFVESWGAHYAVSDRVTANKRIVWIHPDIEKSYIIAEIDKKMYKTADSVVTVSKECRDNLRSHLKGMESKVVFIENIVDANSIKQKAKTSTDFTPDTDNVNLVTVSRITYYDKGLDRVLNAMKRLRDEGSLRGIVWHLIGDGMDRKNMEIFIAANGLENFVKFLGKQKNPFALEKEMDLFLLPSRYEGKPMAVTEAQILGLPCAVTSYTSAKEQVNNGVDGVIIENNDEAIYSFLKNLCENKLDIDELKENVRKKEFSNEQTLKKLGDLF